MVGISSAGLGSGLDVNGLVSQLVAAETQPKLFRLDNQEARLQAEISAIGSLKSSVSEFQTTVSALTEMSTFQGKTTTSSDSKIVKVTSSNQAQVGQYEIIVDKLARSQKLASNSYEAIDDVIGTGQIQLNIGHYDSDANTFTHNPEVSAVFLTIDEDNNTLQGIRDAINNAQEHVNANIIYDGTGYRLALSSTETGENYSIQMLVTDDDGNHMDSSGLSSISYDPTQLTGGGKNLIENVQAQDAAFRVDGLAITASSNQVNDTIEGVTLELLAVDEAPVTIKVAEDFNKIESSIKGFVNSYNSLMENINTLGGYDPETGGILQGDFTLRSVENQLKRMIGQVIQDNPPLSSLADIGIKTQNDGSLILDSSVLNEQMSAHLDSVLGLFAGRGETSDGLIKFVGATTDTVPGDYAIDIIDYQPEILAKDASAGYLSLNALSTLVIDKHNKEFTLTVDGITSNNIVIPEDTYADGYAIAQAIEGEINADSNFVANNVLVHVNFVEDRLMITSQSTGSSSSVDMTSIDSESSNIGFFIGNGTVGNDEVVGQEGILEGSIGGNPALSSDNRFLEGSGFADGIKIEVLGGTTGNRGTVSFVTGIMSSLDQLLNDMLDAEGSFQSRTDVLNDRIDNYSQQREDLAVRAAALEKRYLAQFTALDQLITQMQSTSNFLSQQLANLPSPSSSSRNNDGN